MIRLLAFALNAHERLEFGKGISDSNEPDLWRKDLAGMSDGSMNLQCSIQDDREGAARVEMEGA